LPCPTRVSTSPGAARREVALCLTPHRRRGRAS
jgi:hypothetical protein